MGIGMERVWFLRLRGISSVLLVAEKVGWDYRSQQGPEFEKPCARGGDLEDRRRILIKHLCISETLAQDKQLEEEHHPTY